MTYFNPKFCLLLRALNLNVVPTLLCALSTDTDVVLLFSGIAALAANVYHQSKPIEVN